MEQHPIVQHIPRLRRYARALAGIGTLRIDLVQDTLERALTKFHLWRPGSDLRAWLFAIMHNVFVNQMRSRRLRGGAAGPGTALDRGTRHPGPTAWNWSTSTVPCCALPVEHREVVLLVAVEEMSYDECSRALGVPMGTVMSTPFAWRASAEPGWQWPRSSAAERGPIEAGEMSPLTDRDLQAYVDALLSEDAAVVDAHLAAHS